MADDWATERADRALSLCIMSVGHLDEDTLRDTIAAELRGARTEALRYAKNHPHTVKRAK